MTKVQIKSEKLTPFGGLFLIMEQFDSTLSSVIDSTLGQRCKSFGYQYSEIIRSHTSLSIFSADWSQYKTKKRHNSLFYNLLCRYELRRQEQYVKTLIFVVYTKKYSFKLFFRPELTHNSDAFQAVLQAF